MKYRVEFTIQAKRQLKKFDKYIQKFITSWIEKNLVDTEEPRQYGKPLTGDKKGYWRYRIGDYRIVVEIQDDKLVIVLVSIGHRRLIYR